MIVQLYRIQLAAILTPKCFNLLSKNTQNTFRYSRKIQILLYKLTLWFAELVRVGIKQICCKNTPHEHALRLNERPTPLKCVPANFMPLDQEIPCTAQTRTAQICSPPSLNCMRAVAHVRVTILTSACRNMAAARCAVRNWAQVKERNVDNH